jgi:hypothetical protein
MRSLKGVPFANRTARMRKAQERVGFKLDEIYGGTLDLGAVFAINSTEDAERQIYARRDDPLELSILASLGHLQIAGSRIVEAIADAHASVKKSARLIREEEAAEAVAESASTSAHDDSVQRADAQFREMHTLHSRRRILKPLSNSDRQKTP